MPGISDDKLIWTLSTYAIGARRLLADPESWLDLSDAAPPTGRFGRLTRRVRRGITGEVHPGSTTWAAQSIEDRTEWLVDRIAAVVAPVAATPRVFGLLADRLPIQDALGASAQGLAVCAVAKERGVTDPDDWVPLLGQVLLGRDLSKGRTGQAAEPAEAEGETPGFLKRGGVAVWRLARGLIAVPGLLDARPRGAWLPRMVGKVPVLGLVGGIFDERGGIRRAAELTAEIVSSKGPRAT